MTSQNTCLPSIELFTGAGGLALGTHLAGFNHKMLLEWNADAATTLQFNASRHAVDGVQDWNVVQADIRAISFAEIGSIDLVAGGPPCQPFSIGGKHRGMGDERNMIPQFVRAVRETAPRAFILENVRGLLRASFRSYFSYVILQLTHPTVIQQERETWEEHLNRLEDVATSGGDRGLQYNVIYRLLNAADYGVPQTRERVFVVGFRHDTKIDWHFPEPTHGRDALLYSQFGSGEYWRRHDVEQPHPGALRAVMPRKTMVNPPLFNTKPWRTIRDAFLGLPDPSDEFGAERTFSNHQPRSGARTYVGHTGSPLDWPSKTLKAGDHGVPGGENIVSFPDGSVRYLTVREAARIQTFPDEWQFSGAWSEAMRQLGNAVPVALAGVVAESVAARLRQGG
jgi:DNA (cytosine-5)-methyltransferase 1